MGLALGSGPALGSALVGLPGLALGLAELAGLPGLARPVGLPGLARPVGLPGLALGSAAAVATPPGLGLVGLPALALPELARPVSGRFLPRLVSLPAPLALAALARALARPQPGRVLPELTELTRAPSALMQLGTVTATHASVTCAHRSPRACRCRPTATISLTI